MILGKLYVVKTFDRYTIEEDPPRAWMSWPLFDKRAEAVAYIRRWKKTNGWNGE